MNHEWPPVAGRAEALFNQERQDIAHHLGRDAVLFVKHFPHGVRHERFSIRTHQDRTAGRDLVPDDFDDFQYDFHVELVTIYTLIVPICFAFLSSV